MAQTLARYGFFSAFMGKRLPFFFQIAEPQPTGSHAMTDPRSARFEAAFRAALKPRRPLPNISAYSRSVSPLAIGGWGHAHGFDERYQIARKDPVFLPFFSMILGPTGLGLFGGAALATAAGIASSLATTAVVPGRQIA